MKLYHISQNKNNDYDTYSDAVVCAVSENDARKIHPRGYIYHEYDKDAKYPHGWDIGYFGRKDWAVSPEDVEVEYIGEAAEHLKENSVICASFHAG